MKPVFIYRKDQIHINLTQVEEFWEHDYDDNDYRIHFKLGSEVTDWRFKTAAERNEVFYRILKKFGSPV